MIMKKKIFLMGDSISLHYGSYLAEKLKDNAILYSKPGVQEALKDINNAVGGNCGDSSMALAYLKEYRNSGQMEFDYMIINCGLHDIKRAVPEEKYQVDIKDYRCNLEEMFALLTEVGVKVAFVTTTPVEDKRHNSGILSAGNIHRYNEDVLNYNKVAVATAEKHHVPVIDLYGFTDRIEGEKYIDHVHFNEDVRKLQASFLTDYIIRLFM